MILGSTLSAGCEQSSVNINSLEARVDSLEIHLDSLRTRIILADLKEQMDEFRKSQESIAVINPTDNQRFQVLDTQYGSLVFVVKDVVPQADGARVVFQIGNLTNAIINGGSFSIIYGPRLPQDQAEMSDQDLFAWSERFEAAQEKLLEGVFSFNEQLRPGAWNEVAITLPRVAPNDLGHIELSVTDLPSISLARR